MMYMKRMSTYKFDSIGPRVPVHCGTIGKFGHDGVTFLLDVIDTECFSRITIHNASWDYEGSQPRHGTRVTALAETPYFREDAPSRREALGLALDE